MRRAVCRLAADGRVRHCHDDGAGHDDGTNGGERAVETVCHYTTLRSRRPAIAAAS